MLEQLKTFRLVARYASFTRAAAAAGMTRPAVSQQIKQLEEHFGVTLLHRNTRSVALTAAGQLLLARAEAVLAAVADLEAAMAALRGGQQRVLRIGASTLPGESLLPQVLGPFHAEHPDLEVQVRVGNSDAVLDWLRHRQIDLALIGVSLSDPDLVCTAVAEDEILLALPPGCALPDPLPPQRLGEVPLIVREAGSATRRTVQTALQRAGIDVDALPVAAELGSPEAIKAAVRSGAGCAFLSRAQVAGEGFATVRIAGVDLRRPVCACWLREHTPSPPLQALLARLAECLRTAPA